MSARICGVVLAAGAASRFDSGAKQLATLGGRPMIDHALSAMRDATLPSRRLVVLGGVAERIEAEAELDGFEIVQSAEWHLGISASLRVAIEVAEVDSSCEAVVVTLADQPLVSAAAIDRVCARAAELGTAAALRASYAGRAGHPSAFGRAHFAAVKAVEGDRGAGPVLREASAELVDVTGLGSDTDVDTEEDLARVGRTRHFVGEETMAPPGV